MRQNKPRKRNHKLTPRQFRFLAEYAVDFNAAAAAIRAGYGKPNAKIIGSHLLTRFANNPELTELRRAAAAALGIDRRTIRTGLLTEALGIGPDTRSSVRVRAWGALLDGYAADDGTDAGARGGEAGPVRFLAPDGSELPGRAGDEAGTAGPRRAQKLSALEQRFLEEYPADFCARRAARRAGYSPSFAESAAHTLVERLCDRPELRAAEDARRAALAAAISRTLAGLLTEARGLGPATRSATRVTAWLKLARFLGMVSGPLAEERPYTPPRVVFLDPEGNQIDPAEYRRPAS